MIKHLHLLLAVLTLNAPIMAMECNYTVKPFYSDSCFAGICDMKYCEFELFNAAASGNVEKIKELLKITGINLK